VAGHVADENVGPARQIDAGGLLRARSKRRDLIDDLDVGSVLVHLAPDHRQTSRGKVSPDDDKLVVDAAGVGGHEVDSAGGRRRGISRDAVLL